MGLSIVGSQVEGVLREGLTKLGFKNVSLVERLEENVGKFHTKFNKILTDPTKCLRQTENYA